MNGQESCGSVGEYQATLVVYSFKEHQLDGNRLRCLLHVTEQDGQANVPESTPSLLKA